MEKQELKQFFTGYWNYLAVNAACELKLFDKLLEYNHDFDSLQNSTGWDEKGLDALLHICEVEGLLVYKDHIELSSKGRYLVSTNPEGLYYACLLWADKHLNAWQHLSDVIQKGKPSFESIYGTPFFDFLKLNQGKRRAYHAAMREYAIDDYRKIANYINLQGISSILDVGGGLGALIRNISVAHPEMRCGLFELPEVIEQVELSNITLHAGTFFSVLPQGYDAMVMSRVIHDWDDLNAELILKNIHAGLPQDGKLFLIENLTDRLSNKASGLTLNMMAMCRSFERTESEYLILLNRNGFKEIQTTQLNTNQYIIESIKL